MKIVQTLQKFASYPSFSKMQAPYKEVHNKIKRAVACVKNGTCAQQSQNIMTFFNTAEKASSEVISTLSKLIREEKDIRHKN